MIGVTTTRRATTCYRDAVPEDLRQLMNIEERMSDPWWVRLECWSILRTPGGAGAVAEVDGRAIGFVLYRATPPDEQTSLIRRLLHRCQLWRPHAIRHVRLLHISVAPEWRRQGVAHGLLEQVHAHLPKRDDQFHALVPEANLPAQLLLRSVGYKATGVVHRCSEEGDGYLMERANG